MTFSTRHFIQGILSSPRRLAIPIMTTPALQRLGMASEDAYRSGDLQAQCLKALAADPRPDAFMAFMDLSVEAEAFGCPVAFPPGEVPNVTAPIVSSADDIAALAAPVVGGKREKESLAALRRCAGFFAKPLFGSMIGPFSLSGRLAGMSEIMMLAISEPETARQLLAKAAAFLLEYARAIKATGVDGLIIAEPAAGLLSPEMCQTFAADYLRSIIHQVKDDHFMVILHNCGRTEKQIGALHASGCDALHVGNAVDMLKVLAQVPADFPVMGNIDPVGILKNGAPQDVYDHTAALLKATAPYANFVLSSGCDLPRGVPSENIDAFFRARDEHPRCIA